MGIYVEGTQNKIVKEIMRDRRLSNLFMELTQASPEDKKNYRIVRYKDTGKLDIIDTRKKTLVIKAKEHA